MFSQKKRFSYISGRDLQSRKNKCFLYFRKNICEASTTARENSCKVSKAARENPRIANTAASYQEN